MFAGLNLKENREEGFTLVELLVVILIIGILSAIAIPAFLNQRKSAAEAVQKQDIKRITEAIMVAQLKTNKTLFQITNQSMTVPECVGTTYPDINNLPSNNGCLVAYYKVLTDISAASGTPITGMLDPYGRPYRINPNEAERFVTDCRPDEIGYWNDSTPFSNANTVFKNMPMISEACK